MKHIVVGFDAGNSTTISIATVGEQRHVLLMPSFVGSGYLSELLRVRGGSDITDALAQDEYVLEIGHDSFFVGELATRESADADSQRGNIERYWNGHALRLLLTSVAGMFDDEHLTLRIVTGLPVAVWSQPRVRVVQQSLIGTHHVTFNGVPRIITIDSVVVLMEGAGATFAYGVPNAPQGVIDIGGHTTDLYWSVGARPVQDRCRGFDIGIEKGSNYLSEGVERQYGRPLSPDERIRVLNAFANRSEMPRLYAAGQPITLNGIVTDAVRRVGEEVVSIVSRTWRTMNQSGIALEAEQVLCVGGGARYVGSMLQARMPHLVIPPSPEMANAEGYALFGQRMTEERWARQAAGAMNATRSESHE